MRTTPTGIARCLSILGHPLVMIPAAVATLMLDGQTPSASLGVLIVGAVAAVVFAFSWWQVSRGHWQHVDASNRGERRSLNLFLATALFLAAAIAFYAIPNRGLSLGLFLSALLITGLLLTAHWVKFSLHASFAVFAVALLWPLNVGYVLPAGLLALGVCWSRVRLARHTVIEVLGGGLFGAFIGALFWTVLPHA
ncbi:MAG TPA: phosphatase PAP2 family protein [Xanthobacteraceae bacterium]|nr:phosphatase PAP2 family protein [Xanthobacteraceae bacterium]